jgi:hypothetical protein
VAGIGIKEKTHDRCQPWAPVGIGSNATSPGGIAHDGDHDQFANLQRE